MNELSSPPAPVSSPCVKLCRMDEQRQYCQGCWRTIDEITAWSRLDEPARQQVLAVLPQRAGAALVRGGVPNDALRADPSQD